MYAVDEAGMPELYRRHIDRDVARPDPACIPGGKLRARAAYGPGAKMIDQSVAFRQRHEDLGGDGAARMLPSHQCLDRANRVGATLKIGW